MGVSAKVGTTFTAILLASYLSGVFWKKTALLECNRHGDFLRIQEHYRKESKDALCFEYRGIDYFPYASEREILECENQGYQSIVVDFGCDYIQGRNEYLRCQKKLIVGSTSDWEFEEFFEFLKWTEMERGKDWLYAAFLGGRKNRERLEKKMHLSVHSIPYLESPYWIDETVLHFFHELLK